MPPRKILSKKRPTKPARTAPKKKQNASAAAAAPMSELLDTSDLRRIVLETANTLAPDDISNLLANEDELRRRIGELKSGALTLLRSQLVLALDILRDHLDGECSQIPYRTISIVGAAVLYFTDELDLIPDFLPGVGRLDDAAVVATAFELGHAGIERYCDATGRELPQVAQG